MLLDGKRAAFTTRKHSYRKTGRPRPILSVAFGLVSRGNFPSLIVDEIEAYGKETLEKYLCARLPDSARPRGRCGLSMPQSCRGIDGQNVA